MKYISNQAIFRITMPGLMPLLAFLFALALPSQVSAQNKEEDYYIIKTINLPEGVILEGGGMDNLPDGRIAVCTRRGEVWIIENPGALNNKPAFFKKFASGLHEALGLTYRDNAIYVAQRGELTRLRDTNGDDIADQYETVYQFPISGNYHEYAYGPKFGPDGSMYVTLNVGFFNPQWWIGVSAVKWRGWMLKIGPDGKMTPIAAGLRSPAGIGVNAEGDIFYSENQGDWVGSGWITHLEPGDFTANPAGLRWTDEPGVPERLKGLKPEAIPDSNKPMLEVKRRIPQIKLPSVWFPYGIMGISTSDIVLDDTKGNFGPFAGQFFVGDQGQSKIMRAFLEKVKGQYQGGCVGFREGFASGVLRLLNGKDGSMYVGQTNRGWSSTGKELYAFQKVTWTGRVPFEIKTVKAKPDGFEVEFTQPVNKATAESFASWKVEGFTYQYHLKYGSPVINNKDCPLRGIKVSDDGLRVRIAVATDSLREGYIHEIKAEGVRNTDDQPLLHPDCYYTLNKIPDGDKMNIDPHAYHMAMMAMPKAKAEKDKAAKDGKEADAKGAKDGKEAKDAKTEKKDEEKKAPALPLHLTKMPKEWGKPDVFLTISTKSGLKFDPANVEIKAGAKVKLTFINPDDMVHNLVIVQPGSAIEVGEAAMKLGLNGSKLGYIPKSNKVIAHSALMQPESTDTFYFIAPTKPGIYTYVCTLPGHFYTMQGTMKVSK